VFDKKDYWKRREDGKRGQGDTPAPVIKEYPVKSSKELTKKGLLHGGKRWKKTYGSEVTS
jgi:hypothetical protein